MIHFRLLEKVIVFILLSPIMLKMIKKSKDDTYRIVFILFSWAYIVEFIGLVFFPIILFMKLENFQPAINLIPFNTILEMWNYGITKFFKQIIGNILLFVPMGILVPFLFKKFDKWNKVILLGLVTSISVELIQLSMDLVFKFNMKTCDIDDVILNTIGIVLGFTVKIIIVKYVFKNAITKN